MTGGFGWRRRREGGEGAPGRRILAAIKYDWYSFNRSKARRFVQRSIRFSRKNIIINRRVFPIFVGNRFERPRLSRPVSYGTSDDYRRFFPFLNIPVQTSRGKNRTFIAIIRRSFRAQILLSRPWPFLHTFLGGGPVLIFAPTLSDPKQFRRVTHVKNFQFQNTRGVVQRKGSTNSYRAYFFFNFSQ